MNHVNVSHVKLFALVLSLGIDTLVVSASLGLAAARDRWRVILAIAAAEGILPLVGLAAGSVVGSLVGRWAGLVGGLALLAVGAWLAFREDDDEREARLARGLAGWALLATALSVGLDELAVGFSIGFLGVPVVLTIVLVAAQAMVFSYVGITFGSKLRPHLGEWSERLAGFVLGALGIWILAEALMRAA